MHLIKSIIISICSIMPTKKMILFESAPDLSDNTKAVFDEMIRRNYNNKCKMIWLVSDKKNDLPQINNVKYCDCTSLLNKIQLYYYRIFSRCIITCNNALSKFNKKQFSFFLTHGSPIKNIRGKYVIPPDIDYALSSSTDFAEILAYAHTIDSNKMISLGYPRNDGLYEKIDIHNLFDKTFDKAIIWYPTYRQHKSGENTASKKTIPIIDNIENTQSLNDIAVANNVLLIIKPHFAQDVSLIKELNLSNIIFINDDFYRKNKISSYSFIASCDALLTDYSSVYYDYTLCDKPIGAVWEDIEDYKKNPGFIIDIDYYWQGAVKIFSIDELNKFVLDVANGKDKLKFERNKIKSISNFADDGMNSKRVVDFIIKNNPWIED